MSAHTAEKIISIVTVTAESRLTAMAIALAVDALAVVYDALVRSAGRPLPA
jgi:hypothetical protein